MQKTSFNRFFSLFHQFYPLFHLFIQGVAKKTRILPIFEVIFRKKFFLKFLKKMTFMGVILCEKSIPRIPESWKCFPDPDSGDGVGVLKRKSNIFVFLRENRWFLDFSRRGIDCAYFRILEMLPWPWFREMSVLYWSENMKILDFSSNT